jgi:hypothetical protein
MVHKDAFYCWRFCDVSYCSQLRAGIIRRGEVIGSLLVGALFREDCDICISPFRNGCVPKSWMAIMMEDWLSCEILQQL